MTIEQFQRLPEAGPFYYELRHGELIRVTRPRFKHLRIQRRLRKLLESLAGESGVVEIEVAFRALPEHELRVADVAYMSQERWEQINPDDWLAGAPDLVIEVLSPNDKEKLCLENGCREFWSVDADLRQVKVSTPEGLTTTFRTGQQIPVRLFGAGSLAVDDIFR